MPLLEFKDTSSFGLLKNSIDLVDVRFE